MFINERPQQQSLIASQQKPPSGVPAPQPMIESVGEPASSPGDGVELKNSKDMKIPQATVQDGVIVSGKSERKTEKDKAPACVPDGEKEGRKETPKEPASPVALTILYTNDLHGYVEDHPPRGDEKIVGGFARTTAKINEERAKERDGALALNGGDFFDGGFYSRSTDGEIVGKAIQATGFDAIVLGNHDLNWGREAFRKIAEEMGTDILAANLVDKTKDGTLDSLKPYKIVDYAGMKIGIIGITAPETGISGPDKATIQITDPAVKTKQYMDELKNEQKVDMVIILSHLGEKDDIKLAEQVKGIDVIVGSHSHTAIKTPEKVGDTLIVQAGGDGDYVGKLKVSYDPNKQCVVDYKGELIPITAEIAPDPTVEQIMAPYMQKFKPKAEKLLGHVKEELNMFERSLESTNLTNLFVDAQKKDSDVAIASMFSIRRGISSGPVTAYDLFNTYPFDNELLQVETKGANVLSYLESGLREPGRGMYTLFSGINIEYNPDLPEKKRITSVTFNGQKLARADFEKKDLKVSMDDYSHGKSYFKDGAVVKKYGKVYDILQEYFTNPDSLARLSAEPRYKKAE